jgi:hypothetical protein
VISSATQAMNTISRAFLLKEVEYHLCETC